MQIFFFSILFILTMLCFFYSILSKEMMHKQIFTILSIPLFAGLAVGCLGLESTENMIVDGAIVEHTTVISFITGTYLFSFIAVICLFNLYRYYTEELKDAGDR